MRIELLSPAKNLECGIAAIDHGADAVYIGAAHYGARAAAGNSTEDIHTLCDYAHRFGAKVYVTLNTLIRDDEREDVERLVNELCSIPVDAILVQDPVVAEMVIGTEIHASTQTDNRTAERVRELRDMGFKRVVLARELSVDEIKTIHREVPDIELEAFVHGALCVSYSGACYASEYCFNRSANRGECAQFCRMRFDLVDNDGTIVVKDKHLLSLKDMNRIEHIEALLDAGVTSLKIEGRLKDVSYVKNVTAAYSQRLNEIIAHSEGKYERASMGRCAYNFKPDVRKSFNRGFTDYFLYGRTPDMASFDTPKAMGEYVGRVKETGRSSLTIAGTTAFANGDGLCYVDERGELVGFRVNKVVNNTLIPLKMPPGLQRGTAIYRNNDHAFEQLLSGRSSERRIPISMTLGETDKGYRLTVRAKGMTTGIAEVTTEKQTAQKPQRENIIRLLTKLGGTIYECENIVLEDDCANRFIPASMLTELRRKAVERLGIALGGASVGYAHCRGVPLWSPAHGECNPRGAYLIGGRPQGYAPTTPLMQCRHCLRYALGFCERHGGKKPTWREPLWLVMGDRRCFRLQFDCKKCQMNVLRLLLLFILNTSLLLFTGCYDNHSGETLADFNDTVPMADTVYIDTEQQIASVRRPYTVNYNFLVAADSLTLYRQQPELVVGEAPIIDTLTIGKGERIVVADMYVVAIDTVDTMWVQVASDQLTTGWTHETQLLDSVVPDDPISVFIYIFSNEHLLITLIFVCIIVVAYLLRKITKHRAKILHFNDIPSVYPTVLALLTASAATLYSSIQLFAPTAWQFFYYYPSLNPLMHPWIIALFLVSVWAIIITAIAAVDVVMRMLPVGEGLLYLAGLASTCAIAYIVFSISTLYYVGYALLVAYYVFAIRRYVRHSMQLYVCGKCGNPLHRKGRCTQCGTMNE